MKKLILALFLFSTVNFTAQGVSSLSTYANDLLVNENKQLIFIKLKPQLACSENQAEDFITKIIFNNDNYSAKVLKTEKDELGWNHTRFEILYKGIPLFNKMIISHSLNGKVISINGDLSIPSAPANQFSLSETQALTAALKKINATTYKWENKAEEAHMREVLNQPNFSYYPKGKQVLFEKNGKQFFAYHFNIYAESPLYKADVLVDASNGRILEEHNQICTVDVPGIALTKYSGTQSITCDQNASLYTLKETQRGNGIETYNLNNTTTYASNNFTNSSSTWTTTGFNQAATDAHWGAEKTYDYYFTQHSRNSIDNNGFKLLSYVHYNTNYTNAFWDGARMTYGDGNGTSMLIFTTIDICGHEITHGLTSNTSNLNYSNESGALNESYSDIFGTCIENYGRPSNWNWKVGEQMTSNGNGIRNMSNPGLFGDPDTYNGTNWYAGTADNGGVHTNSGVSNFWFYLLSSGGTGVNDLSNSYTVSALGITNAAKIAFRALTVYYTPSTNYAQARMLSIQAAKDIFGNCSNEVIQTTNAWYAVGVGAAYVPGLIGTNFLATKTNYCTLPAVVNFNNTTANGISYTWYFGDGGTSSATNTAHTYTSNGTYTVKLKATGCSNGLDSIIKPAYITVAAPNSPIANGGSGCANTAITLTASGSSVINWYVGSNASAPIATGSTFVTPNLTTSTTYYVANTVSNSPAFGGILSNINGGYLNNAAQWEIFNVSQNCTLNSVVVYAQTAGNRIIELRNSANLALNATTVNLAIGANTVILNYQIPPGNNYQLGLANGSTSNLYRSNTGVTYPYTIAGCLSLTGSSAGAGYYYWFYNLQVTEADCSSPLIPVTASITAGLQVSIASTPTVFCVSDGPVALNGNPSGGTFSGNGTSGTTFIPGTGMGNYTIYYQAGTTGCIGKDSVSFQVSECVGLASQNLQINDLLIYPNPVKDLLTIQSFDNNPVSIEITDLAGRMVYTKNCKALENVDISKLVNGLYLVSVKDNRGTLIKSIQLIKE